MICPNKRPLFFAEVTVAVISGDDCIQEISTNRLAEAQIGSAISQASPAELQSNRISPSDCWTILTISLVPKPVRVGGVTAGPLVSFQ